MQIVGPLTGALVFLGRHELSAQSDEIEAPFFFQIERNDIYDASIGFRYLFAESGVISANAIVPLNDEGLRPDVVDLPAGYALDAMSLLPTDRLDPFTGTPAMAGLPCKVEPA